MGGIPDWLEAALAAHPRARPAAVPAVAGPGSVCVAEGGGVRRHVLVVALGLEPGVAQVELLTNETDLGGAADVLIPGGESGLAYDLLLERDLTAPVWEAQLGPPLGRVDPGGLAARPPAGLPIVSRRDGRWGWKLRELADLHALGGECLRVLLGE
jgi:hypothetical protein